MREPQYTSEHATRRVRHNGEIKWRGNTIYIGTALVGEPVAFLENADSWTVSYGPILLGTIAHASPDRLRKPKRRRRGLVDNASALPTTPQRQQQKQS